MLRVLLVSLLGILLTLPSAHAQEAGEVAPLEEGEPAPFAGTLLSPEAVANILAQQQAQEERCEEQTRYELERQEVLHQLRLDALQEQVDFISLALDEARQSRDASLEALEQAMRERDRVNLFRTPTFNFVVGVVVGGGLVVLTAQAIGD
jgi:hypothetical protein